MFLPDSSIIHQELVSDRFCEQTVNAPTLTSCRSVHRSAPCPQSRTVEAHFEFSCVADGGTANEFLKTLVFLVPQTMEKWDVPCV